MAYLTDMPGLCRERATRPEHALDLLDSMKREFDKSFEGGIFDPGYVLQKLDSLRRHVVWLQNEAVRERAADYEAEDSEGDLCSDCGSELRGDGDCTSCEADESEKFSRGFNGGYGQSTLEDDG
jgi:hypothetical protein